MSSHATEPQDLVLLYNMFRHKDESGLYCAVPQDRPVPSFLTDDKWDYARSAEIGTLSGFDAAADRMATTENGFYLFHAGREPS